MRKAPIENKNHILEDCEKIYYKACTKKNYDYYKCNFDDFVGV